MPDNLKAPKPFLKWAGGKRQLLTEITANLPISYRNYYEPFAGGGALLFELQPETAKVSDANDELITCYQTIRDDIEGLISRLRVYQTMNHKEVFLAVRALDRSGRYPHRFTRVERAARMMYLNKTCFNGLYRVNAKGQFNTSFGDYSNPCILDEENLRAVHAYLKNAEVNLIRENYATAAVRACEDDFVYLDPPYPASSTTANFTGYTKDGFSKLDHERLKDIVDILSDRGVNVLLSNAHIPFIEDLYKDYMQVPVQAARSINSRASGRGKTGELLIRNY